MLDTFPPPAPREKNPIFDDDEKSNVCSYHSLILKQIKMSDKSGSKFPDGWISSFYKNSV